MTKATTKISRIVEIDKDIDQNLCITWQEAKYLFDYFKPCHPYRLGFMIMCTCGLRPSEIRNIEIKNILNDFSHIKYRANKPTNKMYSNGTLVKEYKIRTVELKYSTLRNELKIYCLKNYHTFKNGKIFQFSPEMFKKELSDIRKKIIDGLLKDDVWKGFMEISRDPTTATGFKRRYRITPYSCRRFYNTFKLWVVYGGQIVLSARDLGHSHIDTNLIYSYSPEKIGLTEKHINEKITFDHLFGNTSRGQIDLNRFF